MTALAEFLFPAPERRSAAGIIRWWEGRRLPYNLLVGTAGVLSLGVVTLVSALPPYSHPLGLPWQPIVVFGVGANLCYALGPATEIAISRLWGDRVLPVGPALFRMGLTFSVGLALLPTLLVCFDYLFRLLRWVT